MSIPLATLRFIDEALRKYIKTGDDVNIETFVESLMHGPRDLLLMEDAYRQQLREGTRKILRKYRPSSEVLTAVTRYAQGSWDFKNEGYEIQNYYERTRERDSLIARNVDNMEPAECMHEADEIDKKAQQKIHKDRKHAAELRALAEAKIEEANALIRESMDLESSTDTEESENNESLITS